MPAGTVRIIGVPMDLGQDRRGVDMGPSALRVAGLNARLRALGYTVEDMGNIAVRVPEEMHFGEKRAKFLPEIAETSRELAQVVARALEDGARPLLLGGDHSLAIGSLAGVAAHFRKRKRKIGLVWLDGHGDMNTPETSPSGNVHGMPLAATLGWGPRELTHLGGFAPKVAPENCAIVGVRDLDSGEKRNIRKSGVRVFTMRDLDELGAREVMRRAIEVAGKGAAGIHVQLDMDVIDPEDAPGTGTPVRGGLTYREAHLAMELLADSRIVRALDIVEINPVLDEHNRTAELGTELVLSALGKRII